MEADARCVLVSLASVGECVPLRGPRGGIPVATEPPWSSDSLMKQACGMSPPWAIFVDQRKSRNASVLLCTKGFCADTRIRFFKGKESGRVVISEAAVIEQLALLVARVLGSAATGCPPSRQTCIQAAGGSDCRPGWARSLLLVLAIGSRPSRPWGRGRARALARTRRRR